MRRLLIEQQLSDKYPVIAHEHESATVMNAKRPGYLDGVYDADAVKPKQVQNAGPTGDDDEDLGYQTQGQWRSCTTHWA